MSHSTDVAKKEGLEALPHPKVFLGDLVQGMELAPVACEEDNDDDSSSGDPGLLQDADVYKSFIVHFGGCGMNQVQWKKQCAHASFSHTVSSTMEAFLVTCYVNVWNCAVSMASGKATDNSHPLHLFTSEGKGSPLRGGWNKAGIGLHGQVCTTLWEQSATDSAGLFDAAMRSLYEQLYHGGDSRLENQEEVDREVFCDLTFDV